jgi:hypothetical protein
VTAKFTRQIDLHVYGLVWACTDNSDSPEFDNRGPAAPWTDLEGHRRFVENVFPVSSFTIDPIPGIGENAPDLQPFKNKKEAREWAAMKLKELPKRSIIHRLDNWDVGGLHGEQAGNLTEGLNERTNQRMGKTMAQEISHALGLDWHTFSPGTPYPRGDRGPLDSSEFGINTTGSSPDIVGPLRFDIMSYNLPPPSNWISSFTYLELLKGITSRGPFESLSGSITGEICAVSWGPNRLDLFVRGKNKHLLHRFWNGSNWGPIDHWEDLGGEISDSFISAVS